MIYTDGTHIISDTGVQELHWFAERVGIGRFFFDGNKYKKPMHIKTNHLIEKGAKYLMTCNLEEKINPL